MKQALLEGIAEILEVPTVTETTALDEHSGWNSLAVVCMIALLDERAGVQVDGQQLVVCKTAGDVLRLTGIEAAA